MAQRVLLHVGLMKSGTTYLQGRLNENRERLAEQGVLFPGPSWARHARAVGDLAGAKEARAGAWDDLAAEIRAFPGTAIVSMEYLGPMPRQRIAHAMESLGGLTGTRVEAVLTVRDLGRTIPAMWQEAMKNRKTWQWDDYLHSLEKGGEAGNRFWRQQGAARIVKTWASVLGQEQVHVITVPPPGAPESLLWDRFCGLAEIQSDDSWAPAPRSNESLGVASALLMGRINGHVDDLALGPYNDRVKTLGKLLLPRWRREEPSIGFTVPRWLRRRAEQMNAELATSGVRIIGDLAELEARDVPGTDPDDVSAEEQLEVAVRALAILLRSGALTRKRARKTLKRLDRFEARRPS